MIKDAGISRKVRNLRLQAEARVKQSGTKNIPELSMDEIRGLIHELETHQIELEMQNDELQNSQDALSELHQQYSDLYDFAPIAYLSTDIKGFIVKSNVTFADMVGVTRPKLLNQPLTDFIAKADQDIFYLQCKNALHSEKAQSFELRLRSFSGEFICTRVDIILAIRKPLETAEFRLMISDITEDKLREGEINKLSQAVESSSSAIILTASLNTSIQVSPQYLAFPKKKPSVKNPIF